MTRPENITLNIDGKKQDIPVDSLVEVTYKRDKGMTSTGYAILTEGGQQLPASLLLSMDNYQDYRKAETIKVILEDDIKRIKIHAE